MPAWWKAHFALACTMLLVTLLPSRLACVSQYHCQRSRSTAPLAGRKPRQQITSNWDTIKYDNKYRLSSQWGHKINKIENTHAHTQCIRTQYITKYIIRQLEKTKVEDLNYIFTSCHPLIFFHFTKVTKFSFKLEVKYGLAYIRLIWTKIILHW
jgi:hypothetical protein